MLAEDAAGAPEALQRTAARLHDCGLLVGRARALRACPSRKATAAASGRGAKSHVARWSGLPGTCRHLRTCQNNDCACQLGPHVPAAPSRPAGLMHCAAGWQACWASERGARAAAGITQQGAAAERVGLTRLRPAGGLGVAAGAGGGRGPVPGLVAAGRAWARGARAADPALPARARADHGCALRSCGERRVEAHCVPAPRCQGRPPRCCLLHGLAPAPHLPHAALLLSVSAGRVEG